jgi:DnaJ like chaperone protein
MKLPDIISITFLVIAIGSLSIFMALLILSSFCPFIDFFFPNFHKKLIKKFKIYEFLSDFITKLYEAQSLSYIQPSINYEVIEQPKKFDLKFNSPIVSNLIKIDTEKIDEKLNFWLNYYNKHTLYIRRDEKNLIEYKKNVLLNNMKTDKEISNFKQSSNGYKIMLIDLLFKISVCDGSYSEDEDYYIKLTVKEIGMGNSLFQKIKSKYITDKSEFEELLNFMKMFEGKSNEDEIKNAYQILKISENSSKEIAKKAYLKLVKQHHPDKVAYLGAEYVEKANLMIQKINSAYELIENE